MIEGLNTNIPSAFYEEGKKLIESMGPDFHFKFPTVDGLELMGKTPFECYLNSTWKPQITVIGMDGVPNISNAGNVLRQFTAVDLSIRLPPNLKADDAEKFFKEFIEKTPILYNAKVELETRAKGNGYVAKDLPSELRSKIEEASKQFFGQELISVFEGGSLPFVESFAEQFPKSAIVVTGILTPDGGAHGPNEFADIKYLKKFLCALLFVLK